MSSSFTAAAGAASRFTTLPALPLISCQHVICPYNNGNNNITIMDNAAVAEMANGCWVLSAMSGFAVTAAKQGLCCHSWNRDQHDTAASLLVSFCCA